jgi:hypothetical protein
MQRWHRFGLPKDLASLRLPGWPIEYGIGLMRFELPRILTPFRPVPAVIGHTGSLGSWLFYCPARDLYLAGTAAKRHRARCHSGSCRASCERSSAGGSSSADRDHHPETAARALVARLSLTCFTAAPTIAALHRQSGVRVVFVHLLVSLGFASRVGSRRRRTKGIPE